MTEDRPPRVNRCRKCDGLLVYEHLSAGLCEEAYGFAWWRCLNCGARVDATILKNKLLVENPKPQNGYSRFNFVPCTRN